MGSIENTASNADKNPLGSESIPKLILQFALPAVVAFIVNSLYNIVDQIFIGQGVGPLGNAATTVSFPLVTIVLSLTMLIGAGGSAYASIKLGEKKFNEAERTLGNVFGLLVVVGIIVAAVGLIFLEPMLKFFGASENIMPYAKDYTSVILVGVPFMMLGAGLSNLARTDGAPRLSMVSMIIGAVLNTILDPIYIFVFNWGVTGAAIATITSQIISALVLIWYFRVKGNMRLRAKYIKPDSKLILSFTALGVSSFITQIANTTLQIILNNSLVYYGNKSYMGGDIALSAMGIVLKVSAILISINIGIGAGVQPILGYNKGARNPKRIKHTYRLAVMYASIVSSIGCIICVLFPEAVLSIFGTENKDFTSFGVRCMSVFMIGVCVSGFQIISTSYFQATGQAFKASILSMLRQIILFVPLVLVLPLYFGIDGILYTGPIADFASAIIVSIFVIKENKNLNAWIAEDEKKTKEVLA